MKVGSRICGHVNVTDCRKNMFTDQSMYAFLSTSSFGGANYKMLAQPTLIYPPYGAGPVRTSCYRPCYKPGAIYVINQTAAQAPYKIYANGSCAQQMLLDGD